MSVWGENNQTKFSGPEYTRQLVDWIDRFDLRFEQTFNLGNCPHRYFTYIAPCIQPENRLCVEHQVDSANLQKGEFILLICRLVSNRGIINIFLNFYAQKNISFLLIPLFRERNSYAIFSCCMHNLGVKKSQPPRKTPRNVPLYVCFAREKKINIPDFQNQRYIYS